MHRAIEALLSRCPDLEITGSPSSTDEALAQIARSTADVGVVDWAVDAGGLDGAAGGSVTEPVAHRLVVLVTHPEPWVTRRVLALGVRGVVLKDHLSRDLATAVRVVHRAEQFVSVELLAGD